MKKALRASFVAICALTITAGLVIPGSSFGAIKSTLTANQTKTTQLTPREQTKAVRQLDTSQIKTREAAPDTTEKTRVEGTQAAETKSATGSQTGTVLIRAFQDDDGDNTYSQREGMIFAGTTFILSKGNNQKVDPTLCNFDRFMLGGVGRNTCGPLPYGNYQVYHEGFDANRWNTLPGYKNPAYFSISAQNPNVTIDFGYVLKENPSTGELEVRAYNDLDGSRTYSDYAEGGYFFDKQVRIWGPEGEVDYATQCEYANNRLGGAGRKVCRQLPEGPYKVQFKGEDSNTYIGPFTGDNNPNGVNPLWVMVNGGEHAMADFGYAEKGHIEIAAYVDIDGNGEYSGMGSGEGKFMSTNRYAIFDIQGQPLDPGYCSWAIEPWGGRLGGAGRATCFNVPTGTYEVHVWDVDEDLYDGPFVEDHNDAGTNPMYITVKKGKIAKAHFGYTSKGGAVLVRSYIDNSPRNGDFDLGEGKRFAFSDYRIVSLNPETFFEDIDYRRHCDAGNNQTGGAGRGLCRVLEPGLYAVIFSGDTTSMDGPHKVHFNPQGVNPIIVTVYQGQMTTVDFAYTYKAIEQ